VRTKKLLAIVALVAWLSTGCFTALGAIGDSKDSKNPKPSHTGLLGGMAMDALMIGLVMAAASNLPSWGCSESCSD